ncbi:MAG TPA: HD domain-containing protein [Thermoanaerobacterales bacterium]|nr:HD domain-containing protein [Thermoanaerobacterales bacterium]
MMLQALMRKLKMNMDEQRFLHSLGVMKTAVELAAHYNADIKKAEIAGLLHDCARDMDTEYQLKMVEYFGILLDDIEKREKALIHGPLGAATAKQDYGINDREILNAIKIHTTGDADMSLLDKIIFLSDLTEPGRTFPGVEELRVKAFKDLDDALIDAFDSIIKYVLSKGSLLHPKTISGRNFILMQRESEGKA